MLPLPSVAAGDVVLGLPSSGPHTNGYSLIRRVLAGMPLDSEIPGIGVLGKALLAPHRCYLGVVRRLRERVEVKALAHLTGGGFIENVPRVLPSGLSVRLDRRSWTVPPLFRLVQERGRIAEAEMFRVFNMGIGMVVIVAPSQAEAALAGSDTLWRIGEVVTGDGEVLLQ